MQTHLAPLSIVSNALSWSEIIDFLFLTGLYFIQIRDELVSWYLY